LQSYLLQLMGIRVVQRKLQSNGLTSNEGKLLEHYTEGRHLATNLKHNRSDTAITDHAHTAVTALTTAKLKIALCTPRL